MRQQPSKLFSMKNYRSQFTREPKSLLSTMMSMASDRPQRQIRRSTHNTDYLYSFPPVNAKQRKNEQHKKNRKMRLNQEVIHWDLRLKFPDVDQLDGSLTGATIPRKRLETPKKTRKRPKKTLFSTEFYII